MALAALTAPCPQVQGGGAAVQGGAPAEPAAPALLRAVHGRRRQQLPDLQVSPGGWAGRAGRALSHLTAPCLVSCRESIVSLKRKYLKHEAEEGISLSQPSMDGVLDAIAKEGCGSLLEEVFLDLEVGALSRPVLGPPDTVSHRHTSRKFPSSFRVGAGGGCWQVLD